MPDHDPTTPGRALLAAYRDERGPSPAAAERLLAALQRDLAAEHLSQATGPSEQVPGDSLAAALPLHRPTRRWLLPAAVLAAAATIAALAIGPRLGERHARDDDPAAAFQRQPTSSATASPRAPTPSTTVLPAPAPAPATRHRREPAPPAPSLSDEMQHMRPAQLALAAGDPQTALTRLEDYARAFPEGRLREEHLALRAIARCQLGSTGAADEATRFLQAHPDSMFAERVRGACKIEGTATKNQAVGHPSPTATDGGP
jgi:hypothetical protein